MGQVMGAQGSRQRLEQIAAVRLEQDQQVRRRKAAALGLAAGSVVIHRPVLMVVGNMCQPAADNPSGYCFAWLPAGGVPVISCRLT